MRSALRLLAVSIAAAASLAGCSSSPTSPSTASTTSTATLVNDVFTGTVGQPVGGVMQSSFNPFTVTTGNSPILVTLTSAVETFPDGSLLPTVTMGLAIGNLASGVCTPIANAFTTAQGSSTAQLGGTIGAGAYCVQVSDVSNQLGPVAYAVAVSHY